MFISLDEARRIQFDVCVIGAGPAGIILALEYSKLNPAARVLLLECGNDRTVSNPLDDSIDIVNPQNHHDPYDCTNKGLGGTSLTWGGRCVMFDEIDFVPHATVQENCTWGPSFLNERLPYLQQAADYFQCGKAEFDLGENGGVIAEGFQPGSVISQRVERWSLPTRFGREYRQDLEASSSISVLQGHYAVELIPAEETQTVESVAIRPLMDDGVHHIGAKVFVVTAGGRESTRLLLRSPKIFSAVGGPPRTLGRYYQGHIRTKIAYVRFLGDPQKTDYDFIRDEQGIYLRRRIQFTDQTLAEHRLLNTVFWLDNPPYYDVTHGNGALSFIYLMMISPVLGKRLLPPAIAQAHFKTFDENRRIGTHILNVLKGLPGSLLTPAIIFFRRYLRRRALPGVFLRSADNRYSLYFHSEQTPLNENRLELSTDGELIVHYKFCDDDVDSVIRAHRLLDEELRAMGCGQLEYMYPEDELPHAVRKTAADGIHQIGTTRIADSPADGVVDANLRVWGTDNVYVCSSSAFPTSSQANPTYFLGVCAIALAHHLCGSLNAKPS